MLVTVLTHPFGQQWFMEEQDQRTIAERTHSKIERTEKLEQHRLVKFCSDVATDKQYPKETRVKAKQLHDGWNKLQHVNPSSPKEQQAKTTKLEALYKRMVTFRNENQ